VAVGTYAGKVTLIDTRTRQAVAQVKAGAYPVAAAVAG
jgi:YVTN family beta-propeller protein